MMTDIRRDSPIFTQKLSISLTSASHEESEENMLILQVLPGTRQHTNGQQENFLHFEITNDVDLYFLYTLDIGEHDFHNLKREQHIVVDFLGFPAKFIGLIDLCFQHQSRLASCSNSSSSSLTSHFVTKLNLTSGILSIVEVNEFNHVSHLNLQFRPGSDDSIKAYLSSSLKFSTAERNQLLLDLEKGKVIQEQQRRRLEAVEDELRLLRENTERDQQCEQARHAQALAQLQQSHLATLTAARDQTDIALKEIRDAKEQDAKVFQHRISELESDLAETSAGKREAEFSVRKLQGEVEKSLAESSFYQASHTDTAALLRTRDQELSGLERDLAKVIAKKEALECQILDKEEILQKATSLREAAEQGRQSALEQLELYKTGLSSAQEKLEAAVGEIRRGNAAIQQLQSDMQTCRGKVQSKNEVIRRQESLVQELRTRLAESNREVVQLKDAATLGDQRRELLERELSTAQMNIAEGADIIQKNQEVISHLNEMINSLQLGGGVGAGEGMNAWASPVRPSRAEQHQAGHYSYQASEPQVTSTTQTAGKKSGSESNMDSEQLYSSPHAQAHAHQAEHSKHVHKVSPDSVAYTMHEEDKQFFTKTRKQQHYAHKQTVERYDLSPQLKPSSLDLDLQGHTGGGAQKQKQQQKGYYDGVLDPRLLAPSNHSNAQLRTHSPSTQYIAGITRSNRAQGGAPAAYSWQLDDFGREGE